VKAFLVASELGTIAALALVLRRRRLPLERLLVLAWSPLALVEIAGSGHNEAFGMLWMVLALLALDADRPLLSALAASAGFLTKYLPGLVAAAWARRYRGWHVLAGAALAAALVALYLDPGSKQTMLLSLSKYAQFWRFNETLFALLLALLGSHAAAVRAGALITLALALALAWRRTEPVAAATFVVMASLLLAPNVLPWYALWLLPLLVLRDEPGALLFTGTISLAYVVYPGWQSGEPWKLGWGWRALEYGPCAAVALRTWRVASARRSPPRA
jgi:alpha-1,6-mannosyltransferase